MAHGIVIKVSTVQYTVYCYDCITISKRSAQFSHRCLFSSSALVQSVVLHSITEMCYNSFVRRNVRIFCKMLIGKVVILCLVGCLGRDSLICICYLMYTFVYALICTKNGYHTPGYWRVRASIKGTVPLTTGSQ